MHVNMWAHETKYVSILHTEQKGRVTDAIYFGITFKHLDNEVTLYFDTPEDRQKFCEDVVNSTGTG